MRIVFMGTPDFFRSGIKCPGGCRPRGSCGSDPAGSSKGQRKRCTDDAGEASGVRVRHSGLSAEKVKDPAFVEILKELHPEAIVVIAFGQILSKAILDIPPYGCVNIHAPCFQSTGEQLPSSGR